MNDLNLTPSQIERRLWDLGKEIDDVQEELVQLERNYYYTKAAYEIALAATRLNYANKSRKDGKNYTTQEREDLAIVENAELHRDLAMLEAQIRATRQNAKRLETQVDIARSVGTSIRSEMKLS